MHHFYDRLLSLTARYQVKLSQDTIDGHGDLQNKKTFLTIVADRFGFLLVDIRQMPVLYLKQYNIWHTKYFLCRSQSTTL